MDSVDIDFFNRDSWTTISYFQTLHAWLPVPVAYVALTLDLPSGRELVQNEVTCWIGYRNIKSKECDTG